VRIKFLSLFFAMTCGFSAQALTQKGMPTDRSTVITFQVTATRQIQQDEIQASLRIEKNSTKSEEVQSEINSAMKMALELSKKYPDVKTSTGRYFVYKDDQKSQWRGSQTILLDSFSENPMAKLSGELQRNGFIVDNYSYTLSEKTKRSMDDSMRLELMQKATQIATNVLAKGLNKKFMRFAQIEFNGQNYSPLISFRAAYSNSNGAASNNPVAQSGLSDVQMTANVNAVFGE
jgi:predicted secreted protein